MSSPVTWPWIYQNDPGMSSKMPEGWQDMIASESQLYFAHGAAVWPERSSPTASQEARPVDETQVAADTQRRYSGLFHSALPMTEQEEETLENAEPWHRPPGYNVLWMAASLFEFNIPTPADRREGGYQYLLYQPGEIFDAIGEKGELWLAMNQDDPSGQVGWIWSKHFAKLADS